MTARVLTVAPRALSGSGPAAAVAQRLPVEALVMRGRPPPPEIPSHSAPLELDPFCGLSVHPPGAVDRVGERDGVVTVEQQPRSSRIPGVRDGVREAARPP